MSSINFIPRQTVIPASWLNDVNDYVYGNIEGVVNVKAYGAVGDGVTNDTTAIQAAITAAQDLVLNRFTGPGATVYFPDGTYLISSTLNITSSNVYLAGRSAGGAMLYAPNASFDLVHFNGSALSLYSVGMMNLKTYTPGNTTSGCHIRVQRTINAFFDNLQCIGWYDGIISDGAGKTYFSNIVLSQENRTAATTFRYGMHFASTSNNNSDVHVSNYQIIWDTSTQPNTTAIRIDGADGIYFTNGHQFGTVQLNPSSVTCASIMWNNIYFDTSVNTNVAFQGTSSAYRNFWFTNCYFRNSGGTGLQFNASSTVSKININGCIFNAHRLYGIHCLTAADDLIIDGCIFDGNNTDNAAGTGDILISGKATISNNRFIGGGAAGTAIILNGSSSDTLVNDNSLASSTAGTRISNAVASNRIRANTGYATKSFGQASIVNPATSVVVNHNLSVTPSVAQISIDAANASAAATDWYISAISSTQFTITVLASPAGTGTYNWLADAEI